MASNFKENKFVDVLQEFQIIKGQNIYGIGSINLTGVYFLVKNGNENYKVLATGQYHYVGTNLIIDDPLVIQNNTNLQVCRVVDLLSSKYIADVANVNTLRNHYNTLVEDFIKVTDILKKLSPRNDSISQGYVLPTLAVGEVLLKTIDGFVGRQLIDVEGEIAQQITEATNNFIKFLDETKKPEFETLLENMKSALTTFTEVDKKNAITTFTADGLKVIDAEAKKKIVEIQTTQGMQGPQGIQGPQGPQGIQGIQGPQGLKGDTGPQGENGKAFTLKGTVNSIEELNQIVNKEISDLYLLGGIGYVWDGVAWVNVGNIRGPQGPQGIQGIQGPQGLQGLKGDTGPQGIQGIQGAKGDIGLKGDTGPQGPQGIQGAKGDKGDKGDIGLKGDTGPQGIQGPNGIFRDQNTQAELLIWVGTQVQYDAIVSPSSNVLYLIKEG